MASNSTTRDDRALNLIRANAVQLFPGTAGERGYALVRGSGHVTYVVSRDGCSCQDAQKCDPLGCKHALAVRWLCDGYRAHRARQAPLSPILMAALAAYHTEQEAAQAAPASAGYCAKCGLDDCPHGSRLYDDQSDLFPVDHSTKKVILFPGRQVAS